MCVHLFEGIGLYSITNPQNPSFNCLGRSNRDSPTTIRSPPYRTVENQSDDIYTASNTTNDRSIGARKIFPACASLCESFINHLLVTLVNTGVSPEKYSSPRGCASLAPREIAISTTGWTSRRLISGGGRGKPSFVAAAGWRF